MNNFKHMQITAYNSYPFYQTFEIKANFIDEPIFYCFSPLLPRTVNYNGLKDVIKLGIDGFDGSFDCTWIEHDSETRFCATFNHLILTNTCNDSFVEKFYSLSDNSVSVNYVESYTIDIVSDENGIIQTILLPAKGAYPRCCTKEPFSDEHLSELIEMIQEIDSKQPENNLEVFRKCKKPLFIKKYKSLVDNRILCSVNFDGSRYNFLLNKNTDPRTNEELFLSYVRKILTEKLNMKDNILSFNKWTLQSRNDLTAKLIFDYAKSSLLCYPDYPPKNNGNKNDNVIIVFSDEYDEEYGEFDINNYELEGAIEVAYDDLFGEGEVCVYKRIDIHNFCVYETFSFVDNSINEILQSIKVWDYGNRDSIIY